MVRPVINALLVAACCLLPSAYATTEQSPHRTPSLARLAAAHFVAADGAVLPLRRWLPPPDQPINAVLIALHGFNDYSRAFELPGSYFQSHGIACYAYDQRGFGLAPRRGAWAGIRSYTGDLKQFTASVRDKHPGVPVYILGESMGAAVAIVAVTDDDWPGPDGLILSAPAVWARSTMPWYQRALLETTAYTMPGLTLTGEGLDVMASDNVEMLRGLGRDPWVIKATRVDAIYGLVDLMDAAMHRTPEVRVPTLLLVGEQDQIIPKEPLDLMVRKLPTPSARVARYTNGYHLLLRDLQARRPWRDIVAWVQNRSRPLPSERAGPAHGRNDTVAYRHKN